MSAGPQDLIRPELRALSAYHVPEAGGLIKLDAMENPYTWLRDLRGAWLERLREAAINRYPDPSGLRLKARLRQVMDIPSGSGVLLGNGSDELIQLIALAVAGPGRVILAPEPSFVMYRMIATFAGMDYVGVPLGAADFELDLEAMLAAMAQHRPAVVFLAWPNNPTGNLFDEQAVRRIIEAAPGLVVVDEAYRPFAPASFMEALKEYSHLLVMGTVSKMGLAGLRLGFLAGGPQWLDEFDKLRLPYNINVLTQISAEFALEHREVLDDQARQIRRDRQGLYETLSALPGLTVWPSQANFILFRTPEGQAGTIFQRLLDKKILIKNLDRGGHPLLRDCLRVTVGTPQENRAFVKALTAALG